LALVLLGLPACTHGDSRGLDFGDHFGTFVSISDNTAVVASLTKSGTGEVHVFVRANGVWNYQGRLVPNDVAQGDYFCIAVSGDTVCLGCPEKDNYEGAVYVFARSGGTWTQQAKLTVKGSRQLGGQVAIDGNTLVIAAQSTGNGKVFVFERSDNEWIQQAVLAADDRDQPRFGGSVAIDGDTIIVGAEGNGQVNGEARIFTRTRVGWSHQQTIEGNDPNFPGWSFGRLVAISGDIAVVGCGGVAVYVFERYSGVWTQHAKLTSSKIGDMAKLFGSSIGNVDNSILIGDRLRNGETGAVYAFSLSDGAWSEGAKLDSSDAASGDQFGSSLATSGATALVGAPLKNSGVGEVYVFAFSGDRWTYQARLSSLVPKHLGSK
jgi:hypothetical protein